MIEKKLHLIWFSGEEKPEVFKYCVETWKKIMPDFEIIEWSMKDVEEIRKTAPYLDQALNNKKWSFAADYLRLWILYNEGGIYLDADVEAIKPIDSEILSNKFFTCLEYCKWVESAVMGAEKGNPMVKEFLDIYDNSNFENEDGSLNMEIIPRIMTDHIVDNYPGKLKGRRKHSYVKDLHIYPFYYFSPKDGYRKKIHKNEETYLVHHFQNSWVQKRVKTTIKNKFNAFTGWVLRNVLSYKGYRVIRRITGKQG